MLRCFLSFAIYAFVFGTWSISAVVGNPAASYEFSSPARSEPALPVTAFACASSARGDSSSKQPCTLYGDTWNDWKEYQGKLGEGSMSFPHPLDRFYSVLGVPMGVPPLVGKPAD
eukprot:TRINITY_DN30379_c0_g1_i1.p1 TRINITY_DN30379_c0_g1~~TRINITY_DN30379_c0_g1_i1.p1  ORF type:complete len:115 (-),score=12.12 TRINITY_DN30379_c0_g1_i1:57-401(-)